MSQDPSRTPRHGRGLARLDESRKLLLGFAIGLLIMTFSLGVDLGSGRRLLPRRDYCASKVLLGRECPGCGLTRSFVALGHGDLVTAVQRNPLGPVLFAAIVVWIAIQAARIAGVPETGAVWVELTLTLLVFAAIVLRALSFYLGR